MVVDLRPIKLTNLKGILTGKVTSLKKLPIKKALAGGSQPSKKTRINIVFFTRILSNISAFHKENLSF